MQIESLSLSVRSTGCLRRVGICTVEQLLNEDVLHGLRKIPNLGAISESEILRGLVVFHLAQIAENVGFANLSALGQRKAAACGGQNGNENGD